MNSRQRYPFVFFLTLFLLLLSALVVVAGTLGVVHAARRVIATTAEHKQSAIRELVTAPDIPISNLYFSNPDGALRPLQVAASRTLVAEEGMGRIAPLPEACGVQYAESGKFPAEICAAFPDDPRQRRLLLAINYCASQRPSLLEVGSPSPTPGSFLRIALSSEADASFKRTWIVVFQQNGKITEATGYSVDPKNWRVMPARGWIPDNEFRGQLWSPVTQSNRCPPARSQQERVRVSVALADATAELNDEEYVAWMRDLAVEVAVADVAKSEAELETLAPYTAGEARYQPWRSTKSVLAPGESVFVGLSEDSQCRSPKTRELAANPLEKIAKTPGLHGFSGLVADALVKLPSFRELESFCVIAPKNGQAEFVVYRRSAAMNAAIISAFLKDALPWVAALSIFILACALLLYWAFGRRLRMLVSQLNKARRSAGNVDSAVFSDEFLKEFASERTEIGTTALAFRDLLSGLHQQHENRKKLDEIISHEIRTPVHNLRRSLPESPDVRRMLTALEVLDQVNDSAEEVRSAPAASSRAIAELVTELCSALGDEYGPIECQYSSGDETAVYVPELLGLTLGNLVKNASRFREQGSPIVVSVRTESAKTFIRVFNKGPSIPVQDHEKIFELGYTKAGPQSDTPKRSQNRGIGLFISRFYMQLMRGNLSVLECSHGAVFEIELPAGGAI